MKNEDLVVVKKLYCNEHLSSYKVSKITGIPVATIKYNLKKLGFLRSHRDALLFDRVKFKCPMCCRRKPISQLTEIVRFCPSVYVCKSCGLLS